MKFYTGSNITIELDTTIDLSTATNPKITYFGPANISGEWTGTISGTSVVYTTQTTDITVAGSWRFQAVVTVGGDILKSEIVRQVIYASLV